MDIGFYAEAVFQKMLEFFLYSFVELFHREIAEGIYDQFPS